MSSTRPFGTTFLNLVTTLAAASPLKPAASGAHAFAFFKNLFAAKDFIRNMMQKNPSMRYSPEQALRHPW